MADPFIGEIRAFAFDYAPMDWAFCAGQTINVQQNPALYAVIGTLYGGLVGQTFQLPDLRGSAPMGAGNGPGLTPRTVGQAVGTVAETLQPMHMPPHNHAIAVQAGNATLGTPSGNFLAQRVTTGRPTTLPAYAPAPGPLDAPLASGALAPFVGGGQPHSNMQPYLALNLCICLNGEYPVRP